MAKAKPEEIAKIKERIAALSSDERDAVLEALEPDILQKVKALLLSATPPEPKPPADPDPKPGKKPFWEVLFG